MMGQSFTWCDERLSIRPEQRPTYHRDIGASIASQLINVWLDPTVVSALLYSTYSCVVGASQLNEMIGYSLGTLGLANVVGVVWRLLPNGWGARTAAMLFGLAIVCCELIALAPRAVLGAWMMLWAVAFARIFLVGMAVFRSKIWRLYPSDTRPRIIASLTAVGFPFVALLSVPIAFETSAAVVSRFSWGPTLLVCCVLAVTTPILLWTQKTGEDDLGQRIGWRVSFSFLKFLCCQSLVSLGHALMIPALIFYFQAQMPRESKIIVLVTIPYVAGALSAGIFAFRRRKVTSLCCFWMRLSIGLVVALGIFIGVCSLKATPDKAASTLELIGMYVAAATFGLVNGLWYPAWHAAPIAFAGSGNPKNYMVWNSVVSGSRLMLVGYLAPHIYASYGALRMLLFSIVLSVVAAIIFAVMVGSSSDVDMGGTKPD